MLSTLNPDSKYNLFLKILYMPYRIQAVLKSEHQSINVV